MAFQPDLSNARIKATMPELYDTFLKRTNTGQRAKLDKLTMKVPSKNEARNEVFVIQGDIGGFQRWDDGTPRFFTSFGTYRQEVDIVRFSNAIKWSRMDEEDAQVERVRKGLRDIAAKYDLLGVDIFFQILTGSTNSRLLKSVPNAPDGLPLFDAGRSLFGPNGNIVSGSGVSTDKKIQDDLERAIQRLQGLTDEHGDLYHQASIREGGLMLCIPTGMYKQVTQALKLEYIEGDNGGSTQNYVKSAYGNIDIMETARLSGNDWYVFASGDEVHKPIIEVARKNTGGLELQYKNETNSDYCNDNDVRQMFARVRAGWTCSYNFAGVKIDNS